jgi:hypothetical protein
LGTPKNLSSCKIIRRADQGKADFGTNDRVGPEGHLRLVQELAVLCHHTATVSSSNQPLPRGTARTKQKVLREWLQLDCRTEKAPVGIHARPKVPSRPQLHPSLAPANISGLLQRGGTQGDGRVRHDSEVSTGETVDVSALDVDILRQALSMDVGVGINRDHSSRTLSLFSCIPATLPLPGVSCGVTDHPARLRPCHHHQGTRKILWMAGPGVCDWSRCARG